MQFKKILSYQCGRRKITALITVHRRTELFRRGVSGSHCSISLNFNEVTSKSMILYALEKEALKKSLNLLRNSRSQSRKLNGAAKKQRQGAGSAQKQNT